MAECLQLGSKTTLTCYQSHHRTDNLTLLPLYSYTCNLRIFTIFSSKRVYRPDLLGCHGEKVKAVIQCQTVQCLRVDMNFIFECSTRYLTNIHKRISVYYLNNTEKGAIYYITIRTVIASIYV